MVQCSKQEVFQVFDAFDMEIFFGKEKIYAIRAKLDIRLSKRNCMFNLNRQRNLNAGAPYITLISA